ncbi:terminase small subunit [Avibacterium paragallinarum]|uniref:Terminase small subunit n=1 Tax=Avibacterium paragallinarum TaxID=728 RepID=A0AAE5TIT0_AVIPA|nr:terminase small subunit [Avibacterium paragallinarum]MEE3607704.1 terminase small subunit [Avibacterium paragallinarum]MEE3620410.1 terminase small subunit [Avibacterium paragallinarum]MEE3668431.1 terminase small subunit [Avibacterium paragallinarum]MEE3680787.1 terminase small subunit [Avibacterium paragallinarum]MEE4385534.1 terminase small subunit [Avibacterium paragallinarum]
MPRLRSEELTPRKAAFVQKYIELGNAAEAYRATHANAANMQPHSLRARASNLINDYRVYYRIKDLIAEKRKRGEKLPHFNGRPEFNEE